MQAVILAAGRGERLRALTPVKPLLPLWGIPLIERTVRTLQAQEINDIIIVTGYGDAALQQWADEYQQQTNTAVLRLVHNDAWASTENGASLLAAAPWVQRPFLLLMADHIYSPDLIASLCQNTPPAQGAMLAVDGDLNRKDIDRDDVTHVHMDGAHIVRIDKGLDRTHGFDTGAFLCSPDILPLLKVQIEHGRSRLTDLMQALADDRRLFAHRVDGHYWQDADTPEMVDKAKKALLQQAAGKSADGWVARYLNRPLSQRLTAQLAHTPMQPNQISLLAFVIGLVAALCLAQPGYFTFAAGGVLVQLASIVDGCDGELARLRLQPSSYGGWLDALLDRYADAAILAGLSWHIMQSQQAPGWMWLGIAALSGSFVASYSAHKADKALPASRLRIGRDSRSLLIMIAALFNQAILGLLVIALLMNAVVVRRIVAMRRLERLPIPQQDA